jgi:hypothetical protein
MTTGQKRVGILTRPYEDAVEELNRFTQIIEALTARGLSVRVIHFTDDDLEGTRNQLLNEDGLLVWVDPISNGRDRSELDPLLREVAAEGVWVTTHPDVIMKMGTKDVLVSTRTMPWGSDCYRYDSLDELKEQLPLKLQAGPRVLKQHRGNGGNGTWKVEATSPDSHISLESPVRVLHAQRSSDLEEMSLRSFADRCAQYFAASGCMVDQPFQSRLTEGMIRCYLVGGQVAGFGHQFVTALTTPPAGTKTVPLPPPRFYYGPDEPEFQRIKGLLESGWVQEMQRYLKIEARELPALWDADFLYGPRDSSGEDTFVLCEINVSSVSPFPDEALGPLTEFVARRLQTDEQKL